MKVELISVDRVIPYARNPRRNENAISKVAASIKEYGFRQPIVVDEEMVIIAGHTRLMAAQSLGLKKVPIHIATGLTSAQVKAYRLADNRTAQEAEWDEELLAIELGELEALDFDLSLTGFDAIELDDLMMGENDGLTDDDEIPEVPENAISKEGDIWILGNHKLLCGDSTKAESIKALMGDELADMIFTDPPYNVDYGQSMKDKVRGNCLVPTHSGVDFTRHHQKSFIYRYRNLCKESLWDRFYIHAPRLRRELEKKFKTHRRASLR